MKFFLCFFILFSLAVYAKNDPQTEIFRLKQELLLKQKELDRMSRLLTQKENELRRLKIWMGTLSADGRMTTVSQREQRLLHGLKILSDASGNMVLKSLELGELLRPRLNALPIASADRVRLVMALEELERSAARVSSIADSAAVPEDPLLKIVRVASVRSELNMAVLSAGALHGVFPGMTFVTADGRIRLRVLESRAMISGAVPVTGDINALTPGASVKLEIIRRAPGAVKGEK